MLKFLTIAFAATSIGAMSAAPAHACGGGCASSCGMGMGMGMSMAAPAADPHAAMAQAPSGTRTYRSYSYEPSVRSYAAPMMRSRSSGPAYSLPKTSPRKYGEF